MALLCMLAGNAYATKPCTPPSDQWFAEHVTQKSDAVIYAKIISYSNFTDKTDKAWTKVQVMKLLHSEMMIPPNLTIHSWQANLAPWYDYRKGDYVVLWLKGDARAFTPTDLSWNQCVPSVWRVREDGQVYDLLQNNHWMSLEEVEEMVTYTANTAH
ncbi:MAG TPA: hypothetical protein VFT64_00105 [Rickettsiales bacterium]|nr:hypothetical protein [Rickettsiales bacterium]